MPLFLLMLFIYFVFVLLFDDLGGVFCGLTLFDNVVVLCVGLVVLFLLMLLLFV